MSQMSAGCTKGMPETVAQQLVAGRCRALQICGLYSNVPHLVVIACGDALPCLKQPHSHLNDFVPLACPLLSMHGAFADTARSSITIVPFTFADCHYLHGEVTRDVQGLPSCICCSSVLQTARRILLAL